MLAELRVESRTTCLHSLPDVSNSQNEAALVNNGRNGCFASLQEWDRVTESIEKELNECLSGVIINVSTCLRMLAANCPNIEGARETARRVLRDSNRAAEAVSLLHVLFSEASKGIQPVAFATKGMSTAALGIASNFRERRFDVSAAAGENLFHTGRS